MFVIIIFSGKIKVLLWKLLKLQNYIINYILNKILWNKIMVPNIN